MILPLPRSDFKGRLQAGVICKLHNSNLNGVLKETEKKRKIAHKKMLFT